MLCRSEKKNIAELQLCVKQWDGVCSFRFFTTITTLQRNKHYYLHVGMSWTLSSHGPDFLGFLLMFSTQLAFFLPKIHTIVIIPQLDLGNKISQKNLLDAASDRGWKKKVYDFTSIGSTHFLQPGQWFSCCQANSLRLMLQELGNMTRMRSCKTTHPWECLKCSKLYWRILMVQATTNCQGNRMCCWWCSHSDQLLHNELWILWPTIDYSDVTTMTQWKLSQKLLAMDLSHAICSC